jgi:hypothetical protein
MSEKKYIKVLAAAAAFFNKPTEKNAAALKALVEEWTGAEVRIANTSLRWDLEMKDGLRVYRLFNEGNSEIATVHVSFNMMNFTVGFPNVRGIWRFPILEDAKAFAEKDGPRLAFSPC